MDWNKIQQLYKNFQCLHSSQPDSSSLTLQLHLQKVDMQHRIKALYTQLVSPRDQLFEAPCYACSKALTMFLEGQSPCDKKVKTQSCSAGRTIIYCQIQYRWAQFTGLNEWHWNTCHLKSTSFSCQCIYIPHNIRDCEDLILCLEPISLTTEMHPLLNYIIIIHLVLWTSSIMHYYHLFIYLKVLTILYILSYSI